jgi:hypothetical protein
LTSYRFRRRAFISAVGGGIGLKVMLRTLEGSAQGARSPARLLVTHWPVGIVAGTSDALWKPTSGSVGGSIGLKPFADQGLGPDMTVIRGLSTSALSSNGSGGHEGGTVMIMTGVAPPGTRSGEAEADDAYAGGPSIDQILLQNVPALQRPGAGFAGSIADSRTDFGELSTKTLSYSTQTQQVGAAIGPGIENKPLPAVLSPLTQYTNLFANFIPGVTGAGGSGAGAGGDGGGGGPAGGAGGGAGPRVADAMLKKLVGRRSVLDFALEELNQVKLMAPGDARSKLGIHADAVLSAENAVTNAINATYPDPGTGTGGATGAAGVGGPGGAGGTFGSSGAGCTCKTKPASPPMNVVGMADPPGGAGNAFGNPVAKQDDSPLHAQVGAVHFQILQAAFICDLIRVATYQWSPGTNHVGFGGLMPGSTSPFMHHPTSHRINTSDTTASSTVAGLNPNAAFLLGVQQWYFARHAENLANWKNSVDGCGNNLLDFTCVPFLTEVMACGHERSNMAAMLIGGRQLGFLHGRYVQSPITINQFWGTVAQAFGYTSTDPPFAQPVAGFWAPPL